jgi:hypothetical protein
MAALTYFAGCICIDIFCPKYIKEYETLEKFLQETSPKVKTHIENKKVLLEIDSDEIKKLSDLFLQSDDIEHELLSSWEKKDESWVVARSFCTLFFMLACFSIFYLAFYDAPRRVLLNSGLFDMF